jgi:hypothetical protein
MGFDPAYARFRPVHSLIGHRVRLSIQEGLREVNFLGGDDAYKAQYVASGVAQLCLTFLNDRPRSLLKAGTDLALAGLGRVLRRTTPPKA